MIYVKKLYLKNLTPYLYLLPCFILFFAFKFYPLLKTILLSFQYTDSMSEPAGFAGWSNYWEILNSPEIQNSILVSISFVALTVLPSIVISFFLALAVVKKQKDNNVYEMMFAATMSISTTTAAMIWMILFHPTAGIINYLLQINLNWMHDKNVALLAVSIVSVWLHLGINFIFFLTALRNVPQDILESAVIDGVNPWQKILRIVIPMISPAIFFIIFMNLMSSFQAFAQFSVLTEGGPGGATEVFVLRIYNDAFVNSRVDRACAESVILFLMMLAVTLIQFRFENKGVHYS